MKRKKPKPVELVRRDYQPTKAELEKDMSIKTTPEQLAHVALRRVKIKEIGK